MPAIGPGMKLSRQRLAIVACALVGLTGCDRQSSTPAAAGPAFKPSATAAIAPGSAALSHGAAPPVPAPETTDPPAIAVRGDPRPPELVLRQWGTAIERRDWAAVRALWGHGGADSGLGPRHFAARWDRLRHPLVSVGAGAQDGAAGSLYYSAPVTISDGSRQITGTVTIRRANDVPGASPEQLRWHAEATTRAPWTTLR